jgi:hypothetical protein
MILRNQAVGFSVMRPYLSVPFLFAAFVLLVSAFCLRPAMNALSSYYTKEPIKSRRSLTEFDVSELPSFQQGWDFRPDSVKVEDVGTDKYIFVFLTRQDKRISPHIANLFVTYYSDPKDKVPHSPDVCYRQGGAVVKSMKTITIEIPELAPQHPQIPVNCIIFDMGDCAQVVLFCYCVEAQFETNREKARWIIGKPGNRYTYVSKIETASNFRKGDDPVDAINLCTQLFREAVVVLLRDYFPTEDELKGP